MDQLLNFLLNGAFRPKEFENIEDLIAELQTDLADFVADCYQAYTEKYKNGESFRFDTPFMKYLIINTKAKTEKSNPTVNNPTLTKLLEERDLAKNQLDYNLAATLQEKIDTYKKYIYEKKKKDTLLASAIEQNTSEGFKNAANLLQEIKVLEKNILDFEKLENKQ